MPAKSAAQQRFFGAELNRARHGEPTRTHMSESQLADFAGTKRAGLPERVAPSAARIHALKKKVGR